MATLDDRLISDLDADDDLYCGNCGLDYDGLTVSGLAEIVTRRGCSACRQYLDSLRTTEQHSDPGFVADVMAHGPDEARDLLRRLGLAE